MTEKQKLEFGIEIIAGMKAIAYGVDMEVGRILALQNTETDRIAELDFESLPEEKKAMFRDYCDRERAKFHEQAIFIAQVALAKLEEIPWEVGPPLRAEGFETEFYKKD